MRHLTLAIVSVLVVFAMLAPSRPGAADTPTYVVIVHPDNAVTEIARADLRDAYLKKRLEWAGGTGIRPADLSRQFAVREQFTAQVIGKSMSQLRSYWNQRIFSGKGVPPVELDSTDAMIAWVLSDPGAVGYLPADVDPRGAKVVGVR